MNMPIKYLIISDIHLSSAVSRSDMAMKVLDMYDPTTIIINGDLVDSEHLKRLRKNDWKFLSKIRKLSDDHKIIVVKGNHDGGILDLLGDLLGLEVVKHTVIVLGEKKYYVVHGDQFDDWISERPWMAEIGTALYYWFQKLGGRKQRIALFLKHYTKTFLRCTDKVKRLSHDFCLKHGYNGLIAGHTHYAEHEISGGVEYWNSGCLADADGKNSYIVINNNNTIEIKHI